MRFQDLGLVANGDINVGRFVKLIAGTRARVVQAGANDQCFGVSTQQPRRPAITGTLAATTLAASVDEQIDIEQIGSLAWVVAGEAVVEGALVKSDANGKAVNIATTGIAYQYAAGIVVIPAANADEYCQVLLHPQKVAPGAEDDGGGLMVAKTADYTVVNTTDDGKYFTTQGAAGAVIFTLPTTLVANQVFVFYNEANQNMTVAAPAGKLVAFNNLTATSVALSTAGNKIGSGFRVRVNVDATKYLVEPIGAGTVTVA